MEWQESLKEDAEETPIKEEVEEETPEEEDKEVVIAQGVDTNEEIPKKDEKKYGIQ